MALQSSGAISLANLQTEFGGSNPISLSEYYRNGSYVTDNNSGVPVSGIIQLDDFYGAVKQFAFTISSNYSTPQDLRTLALAAGWNGSDYLVATLTGKISSNTTSSAAFTISGSFPNAVKFINAGYIVGMGGKGGDTVQAGSPGGTALAVSSSVSIQNSGVLAGGGGGGGAGVYWSWDGLNRSTPGSGGASGFTQAAGGGGGPNTQGNPSQGPDGNGFYTPGGASANWAWGGRASSPGGMGGSWGNAGDAGGTVDGVYNYSGYAGGAGGAAVTGNGYVTWLATGTRYGAVS
jgi:hypothetical protein